MDDSDYSSSPSPIPRTAPFPICTNTLLLAALHYITSKGGFDSPPQYMRRVQRIETVLLHRVVPETDDDVDSTLLCLVRESVERLMEKFDMGKDMAMVGGDVEDMRWVGEGSADAVQEGTRQEDSIVEAMIRQKLPMKQNLEKQSQIGRAARQSFHENQLWRYVEDDERMAFVKEDKEAGDLTAEGTENIPDEEAVRSPVVTSKENLTSKDKSEEETLPPPDLRFIRTFVPSVEDRTLLRPRRSENLDNIEVERIPKYGGLQNSPGIWHHRLPLILPLPEMPLLAHWETRKIDTDLRASALSSDEIIENSTPLHIAIGPFENSGQFESGSKFKLPEISRSLAIRVAPTCNKDLTACHSDDIADHGRDASGIGQFIPNCFSDEFLPNENAVERIRRSVNMSPTPASKTARKIHDPKAGTATPIIRDPPSTDDNDLTDELTSVTHAFESRAMAAESYLTAAPNSTSAPFRAIGKAISSSNKRSSTLTRPVRLPAPAAGSNESNVIVLVPSKADAANKLQAPGTVLSKRKRLESDVGVMPVKRVSLTRPAPVVEANHREGLPYQISQQPTPPDSVGAFQSKTTTTGKARSHSSEIARSYPTSSKPKVKQQRVNAQKNVKGRGSLSAGYESVERSALRSGKIFKEAAGG